MKGKVLRYFAGFLIFILTCTVVSRGVYAYQIPQVTVVRAETKEITHKIEADGKFQEMFERAVIIISGIRVEEICVRQGDTVKKGDVLFLLSKKGINNKIQNISTQIEREKGKLQRLEEAKELQKKQHREKIDNARKKAAEEIAMSDKEQKQLIENARKQYRKACKELSSYLPFTQYLKVEESKNLEYQTLKKAAERKGAKREDKEAFEIFKKTFELSLEKEWKEAKETLQKEKESAKQSLEDARVDVKNTADAQELIVGKAQREYDDACAELAAYPTFSQYLSDEKECSLEYQTLKAAAMKKDASEEEKENFKLYQEIFERNVKKEWQEAKRVLEKAVKAAKIGLESAKDEEKLTNDVQKALVDKALAQYNAVCREVDSYITLEKYIEESKESSMEYQNLKAAAESEGATQEEKEAFVMYETALTISSRQEWNQGKTAIEKAKTEAEQALEECKQNRKRILQQLRFEKKWELEDLRMEELEKDDEIELQKENMEELAKSQNKYQKLLAKGGKVTSSLSGIVKTINIAVGDKTPDNASVIVSGSERGWEFTAEISEEDKNYLKEGDKVTIVFGQEEKKWEEIPISSIEKIEGGMYQVHLQIKGKKQLPERTAVMNFQMSSNIEECCVPLAALRADGVDYYVLVLKENETFLGKEYNVEKRKVMIQDKNEEYAALQENALSGEEEVVTLSDKEVRPGDTVRMPEEDA